MLRAWRALPGVQRTTPPPLSPFLGKGSHSIFRKPPQMSQGHWEVWVHTPRKAMAPRMSISASSRLACSSLMALSAGPLSL